MKKIIKRLFKRGKYFIAVFLILYMFLIGSISASASALLYDDGDAVPAPADLSISFECLLNIPARYHANGVDEILNLDYKFESNLLFPTVPLDFVLNNPDDSSFDSGAYDFFDASSGIYFSDKINLNEAKDEFPYSSYNGGLAGYRYADYLEQFEFFDPFSEHEFSLSTSGLTSVDSNYRGFVLLDDNFYVDADIFPFNSFGSFSNTYQRQVKDLTFSYSDFSFWTDEEEQFSSNVAFVASDFPYFISAVKLTYTPYGSSDIYTKYFFYDDVFNYDPTGIFGSMDSSTIVPSPGLFGLDDGYYYVHSLDIVFDEYNIEPLYLEANFNTIYYYNPKVWDEFTDALIFKPRLENPAVPLISYTTWLGTAVTGFLDLEIFPYFSLGGIFMTLLAFTCVVWFLKLVAGG